MFNNQRTNRTEKNLHFIYDPDEDINIVLIPEAFNLCNQMAQQINSISNLTYEMEAEIIANAMIATGIFAEAKVIENISQCVSMKQKQDNKKYALDICSFVLPICRNYQAICTNYLKLEPSLEMVINALLLTGTFDSQIILQHIIDSFAHPLIPIE